METNFTAIDFETAHGKRWSICQVGLVRVEDRAIKQSISLLVCPPKNYYFYMNTQIHGIAAKHTCNAPAFSTVWLYIKSFIQNQTVVAHNGAFDFNCLHQTLDYYGIDQPDYDKRCTYKIYGKNLATLCKEHKIALKHHDALSDARACAELYIKYLNLQTVF